MGKFGIGARVRDEDGDEGVIVGKRKGERQVKYNGIVGDRSWLNGECFWWSKATLTPIAANDATPEWQPKVGDRVRVVKHRNWFGDVLNYIEPGSEVELTGLLDDGDFEVPEGETWTAFTTNTQYWIRSDDLEPLPVAAEAQGAGDAREDAGGGFKAGDRIRLIASPLEGMPLGSEYIAVARTSGNAGSVHFKEGNVDYVTWRPGDYFELVQPLTIEAGKYYRTRDGRKVGPMRKSAWRNSFFSENPEVSSQDWFEDGSFIKGFPSCLDLVAEWVDEPAVVEEPVAVAPATATPASKFKVGDRVRVKGGTLTGTIATRSLAGAMSFVTDGDTVAGPEFWFDDELELVERTIRPGTYANLRVKVTSVNGKQANIIIPGLRNPSHGVPLSALVPA